LSDAIYKAVKALHIIAFAFLIGAKPSASPLLYRIR